MNLISQKKKPTQKQQADLTQVAQKVELLGNKLELMQQFFIKNPKLDSEY